MKLDATRLPITIRQPRRARILWYFLPLLFVVSSIFIGGWIRIIFISLAVIILIVVEISRLVYVLIIDPNKISLRSGLINIDTASLYYNTITDIKISQNLWERLFRFGKLYVNTPGRSEYEIMHEKTPNPHAVRIFVEKLKNAYLNTLKMRK